MEASLQAVGTLEASTLDQSSEFFPLVSYNNLAASPDNTCGQAALATLADFYGRDQFAHNKLQRKLRPDQLQKKREYNQWMQTGKLHYENEPFVGLVHKLFPPDFLPPINMSTRETLMGAFKKLGIRYQEHWPDVAGDRATAKRALLDYFRGNFAQRRWAPVLVLLDMLKLWPGGPFKLHWGVVHGVAREGVLIASWHKSEWFAWEPFLDAWHCWFLPHPPNQFYQLRTGV